MNHNGALVIFFKVAQKSLKGLIFDRVPLQLLPRYFIMLGHLKFTDIFFRTAFIIVLGKPPEFMYKKIVALLVSESVFIKF